MKWFWSALSRLADVIGIIGFAGVTLVGVVVAAKALGEVPAWTLAIAIAAAVGLAIRLIQKSRASVAPQLPNGEPDQELQERFGEAVSSLAAANVGLEMATGYLRQIDDFIAEIRQILVTVGDAQIRHQQLEKVRVVVYTAIFEGVHGSRGEKVRAVYCEPIQEDGRLVLCPRSFYGHSEDVRALRLHADRGSVAGRAYTERKPIYVEQVGGDPRVQDTGGRPIGSLVSVPVRQGHRAAEPMGVLSVASSRPTAFSPADVQFISVCASVIALIEFGLQTADGSPRPPLDDGTGQ